MHKWCHGQQSRTIWKMKTTPPPVVGHGQVAVNRLFRLCMTQLFFPKCSHGRLLTTEECLQAVQDLSLLVPLHQYLVGFFYLTGSRRWGPTYNWRGPVHIYWETESGQLWDQGNSFCLTDSLSLCDHPAGNHCSYILSLVGNLSAISQWWS